MDVMSLVARLSLDSTQYMAGMAAAKGMATKSGTDIVKAVANTKKAIGLAAVGMVGSITAFAASSVKTGMEFDKSMSQVAATMGKTMDEMASETGTVELAWGSFTGNLREFAQEMGANTAFSASQAADALNYMALAGYNTQESMSMLPNVLNLAAAGNMDLARASDMVTDTQTAFGLSMEEMPQLVNEMAKAASTGNTSVEQLGDAFLTVGGLAQELNGGLVTLSNGTKAPMSGVQELETALVAMANAGIKGSEAGTHMRNMLLKLSSPTSEGTKQLEALGVSVFDSEGKMRSLKDVFGDLDGALSGLTQEQKIQAISDLFNTRDLASAEALLNAVGEDWDEIGASILDSEGAAQKMADTQLDNLAGDITIMKSAFEGLQISVSDKLEPAMRALVQAITWLIDNANTVGPIILGVATAFGVFAIAINIGGIIQGVTTAIAALNAVLLANPIGIVVALIAGLVVAFVALWKNNEGFRNAVTELWNSIKEAVGTAIEGIKAAFQSVADKVGEIKDAVVTKWEEIKTAITEKIEGIKTTVTRTVALIKAAFAFEGVAGVVKAVFNIIKSVIQSRIDAAKARVSSAVSAIKRFLGFSGAAAKASTAFNNIKQKIQDKIDQIKEKVKGMVDKIKGMFPFNIGQVFKGFIKLPSINVSRTSGGGATSSSSTSTSHFAKAMNQPYLFNRRQVFYEAGDAGEEILMGRQALKNDLADVVKGTGGTINIYLNYQAGDDANDMVKDIARNVQRLRMAGVM